LQEPGPHVTQDARRKSRCRIERYGVSDAQAHGSALEADMHVRGGWSLGKTNTVAPAIGAIFGTGTGQWLHRVKAASGDDGRRRLPEDESADVPGPRDSQLRLTPPSRHLLRVRDPEPVVVSAA
jgi:hypothetical protein